MQQRFYLQAGGPAEQGPGDRVLTVGLLQLADVVLTIEQTAAELEQHLEGVREHLGFFRDLQAQRGAAALVADLDNEALRRVLQFLYQFSIVVQSYGVGSGAVNIVVTD